MAYSLFLFEHSSLFSFEKEKPHGENADKNKASEQKRKQGKPLGHQKRNGKKGKKAEKEREKQVLDPKMRRGQNAKLAEAECKIQAFRKIDHVNIAVRPEA